MHILRGRQPEAPLGALMGQQPCGQLVGHLDITAEVASCVLGGIAQKQRQPLGAPGVQARLIPLQPLSLGQSQVGGEGSAQEEDSEVSIGQNWTFGVRGLRKGEK